MKNDNAFPVTHHSNRGMNGSWPKESLVGGLTKREYFACAAMQGILANPNLVSVDADGSCFSRCLVEEYAIIKADALIAELSKTKEK